MLQTAPLLKNSLLKWEINEAPPKIEQKSFNIQRQSSTTTGKLTLITAGTLQAVRQ